jgi:hypothetical protein
MALRWLNPYPVCKRIIVNLRGADSPAFRGVLWQRRGGYLVLRDAQMLRPRMGDVTMDGEVLVPTTNIEFIQVLD